MPGAALGAIGGGAAAGAASGRGGLLAVQAALGAADLIGVKQTLNRLDRNVARATARVARIRGADDGPVPSLGLRPQPMGVAPSRGPGRYGRHFDTIVDRVEELQANPAEATMRVTQALEPLARVSPEAGTAASLTALKGLAYLASRLPSSRTDPYSLTPGAAPKRRPISGLERAAFLRSAEAVNDPLVVLAHAEKGTLSREHVEAVKAVYPETFAELRAQVLTATMQRTTPLPYATRVQIGLLMDGPTDPTMTPAFLRAAASNYSAPAPEHPPGQQKEINVPLRLADSTQTMFGGDGVARRR
jgi:hypothetical protein